MPCSGPTPLAGPLEVVAEFERSWSSHDHKALGRLFAEDADWGPRALALADKSHELLAFLDDVLHVEIDAAYGAALREAKAAGVEVLAYGVRVTAQEICVERRLDVLLD